MLIRSTFLRPKVALIGRFIIALMSVALFGLGGLPFGFLISPFCIGTQCTLLASLIGLYGMIY